jgi:hypothetical protein
LANIRSSACARLIDVPPLNVEPETFDYAWAVQTFECFERMEKIEEVTTLVSLQECTQLRREHFLA